MNNTKIFSTPTPSIYSSNHSSHSNLDEIVKDFSNNINLITPELKLIVEKNIYRFIEDNKNNNELLSNIIKYLQDDTTSFALNNYKIIINNTEYKLIDLLNIVNYHRPKFFGLNNIFGGNNITKTSDRIIQTIYFKNQTIRFSNDLKYYVKNKHKINKHVKDIIVSNLKKIIDNASYELRKQIYQVLSPHSDGEVTEIKNENIQNMLEIILYHRHSNFIKNETNSSLIIQDYIISKSDSNNLETSIGDSKLYSDKR